MRWRAPAGHLGRSLLLSRQIRLCGTGGAGDSVVREVVPGRHCFEEGTARAAHLAGGGRM